MIVDHCVILSVHVRSDTKALDRELKRGSAELLILSLLDPRPRHGYGLSKLIHSRSAGQLTFHLDSLYPLLYRLEERGWIKGAWVEKPEERRRRSYKVTAEVDECWRSNDGPGKRSCKRSDW